ncbi:cell division protein [Chitinophaga alhagiae]|uniref:Cell division protein n=1 Tax=Chitinophaga alhagiae TaxID=2203219 RepID=A0ABM6WE41_9BACT|nr:SRPBCC family protein [Chitinophaga alhagiae]AWO02268.1 cell division protein [Chitinophaga alhagiae]
MPLIHLTTVIHAPLPRVFDLSRSITLHKRSMEHLKEEAIRGRTSGLIELNETVTWRAKHLNKMRELTTRITSMQKPHYFCDEMEKGDFTFMKHEHHFKEIENGTIVIDIMEFGTPYGRMGRWLERLYLRKYMKRLLQLRNKIIKEYAESEKWRVILD